MGDFEYEIPNDDAVSRADIQSKADVKYADLSKADLRRADLSEMDLFNTNLSEAYLVNADLSEADLRRVDLSEADLSDADLSEANLRHADLSKADLKRANFSEANLTESTLTGAILSRETEIDAPSESIEKETTASGVPEQQWQDTIARANRELRTAYSANGLLSRARAARFCERRARRKEAKVEGGLQGNIDWFFSLLSSVFTGYGVRLRPVVGWMLLLHLVSTVVYWHSGEMAWGRSLYYSVVTFTTSPPETPPPGLPSIVAGFETFAGTAAIVFLGYVLSSRERI